MPSAPALHTDLFFHLQFGNHEYSDIEILDYVVSLSFCILYFHISTIEPKGIMKKCNTLTILVEYYALAKISGTFLQCRLMNILFSQIMLERIYNSHYGIGVPAMFTS